MLEWSVAGETEWDFPLVTQIPDRWARAAVRRYLWALRGQGVLDAEYHRDDGNVFETGPGVAIVAFGSAARGTARADSDLDLVVVQGSFGGKEDKGLEEIILNAAAEVSLQAPRALEVHVVAESRLARLPREVARGIKDNGLIVFDAIHSRAVWDLVYGGRPL